MRWSLSGIVVLLLSSLATVSYAQSVANVDAEQ
jgi:hypothetical protein